MTASTRHALRYKDRDVDVEVVDDREFLLRLDGIVRKRRSREGVSCVYVWTNVELHWEEHHFIEARWWPDTGRIELTVNGTPLLSVNAV
jgi:hypothetical protein